MTSARLLELGPPAVVIASLLAPGHPRPGTFRLWSARRPGRTRPARHTPKRMPARELPDYPQRPKFNPSKPLELVDSARRCAGYWRFLRHGRRGAERGIALPSLNVTVPPVKAGASWAVKVTGTSSQPYPGSRLSLWC